MPTMRIPSWNQYQRYVTIIAGSPLSMSQEGNKKTV